MAGKGTKKRKTQKKVNIQTTTAPLPGFRVLEGEAGKKPKKQKREKGSFPAGGIILIAVLVLLAGIAAAAYWYITANYTVTNVYVEGNVHYSNEEIMDMVMSGRYGNNSLILSWKYRDKSIEGIPFIEKMDVSVLDPHTVKIEVYEKALAGYVEYLDRYLYFDKDGIVVESSTEKTKGIPMVTGLSFDHVVLYQVLPVEDPAVFSEILSITQLVNKYNLIVDRIFFGSDNSLTLYFENVKADFGNSGNLEEKVMELQYILPELTGKSGTLRMENYTEETKTITFEPDSQS